MASRTRPTAGDYVRITDSDEARYDQIGKIVEDDGSSLPFDVEFPDGNRRWMFANDVEKVPAPGSAESDHLTKFREFVAKNVSDDIEFAAYDMAVQIARDVFGMKLEETTAYTLTPL